MAESDESKPVAESKASEGTESLEIEAIDQILNEADPEFNKSLEDLSHEISKVKIEIEPSNFEGEWDAVEPSDPALAPARSKVLKVFLIKGLRYLGQWIKYIINHIIMFFDWVLEMMWQGALFLIFDGRKKFFHFVKDVFSALASKIKQTLTHFERWSWPKKLSFVGMVAFASTTTWLAYRSLTHGLMDRTQHLFKLSVVEDIKGLEYESDDVEGFYDSIRHPQNVFQLTKMVVNLKRSSHSGPNPMGAFQFYVDASSKETLVEIKDREVEIRDLVQRTLEEFTYDQVSDSYEKTELRDKVKAVLNQNLTTGRIKKIMLGNLILKP